MVSRGVQVGHWSLGCVQGALQEEKFRETTAVGIALPSLHCPLRARLQAAYRTVGTVRQVPTVR